MRHELKTWPDSFKEIAAGVKRFEVRFNDRNYQAGDLLVLSEFLPDNEKDSHPTGTFTGQRVTAMVDYVMDEFPCKAVKEGYVIMSITPVYADIIGSHDLVRIYKMGLNV